MKRFWTFFSNIRNEAVPENGVGNCGWRHYRNAQCACAASCGARVQCCIAGEGAWVGWMALISITQRRIHLFWMFMICDGKVAAQDLLTWTGMVDKHRKAEKVLLFTPPHSYLLWLLKWYWNLSLMTPSQLAQDLFHVSSLCDVYVAHVLTTSEFSLCCQIGNYVRRVCLQRISLPLRKLRSGC